MSVNMTTERIDSYKLFNKMRKKFLGKKKMCFWQTCVKIILPKQKNIWKLSEFAVFAAKSVNPLLPIYTDFGTLSD